MEEQEKEQSLWTKPMNEYTLADSLKIQAGVFGVGIGLAVVSVGVLTIVDKIQQRRLLRKLDKKSNEEK